jgi:5-methylcytosine-specific restriction protein A
MPINIPTARTMHATAITPHIAQRRATEADAFYNQSAWRKLSALYRAMHPLCARCQANGRLTPSQHVHHISAVKDDPERSHDWDNLEALCRSCHSREHVEKK